MNKIEKFKQLVAAWANDEDALEYIEKDMNSFGEYVNARFRMEMQMTIATMREGLDATELANIRHDLDQKRHDWHETAITGVKRICRFATIMDVEPLFTGDFNNREEIANFCMEIVNEFFGCNLSESSTRLEKAIEHRNLKELVDEEKVVM